MAQSDSPIPLICIGRTRGLSLELEQSVAPHFTYPAIIDFPNYSPDNIGILLATLNPSPAGIVVGGGLTVAIQQEVEKVVQEHNAAGRYDLKLVCIPVGIREKFGAEGVIEWIKEALGKEFDVE